MTEKEIVECWGLENLVRWSEEVVRGLRIPEKSKLFLTNVGLPSPKDDRLWKYEYEFNVDGPLRLSGEEGLVRIGPGFCLDEKRGGCIFKSYPENDMERFVNSSVEQFVAFLTAFQSRRQEILRFDNAEPERCKAIISEIEEEMCKVDPVAFNHKENYWSVVLEDMRYPYLTDEELDQL